MHAVIVANGELHANARLKAIWERADLRIAADGGARNAQEYLTLAPQVIIGDLDSLDSAAARWSEGTGAEMIRHRVDKNETDLELAVNLAQERGADRITILGALGGRVDQSAANIMLLARSPDIVIAEADSEMWAARGSASVDGSPGDIVSLIPLDDRVEGLVTHNLEYALQDQDLRRDGTRGISNRMTADHAEVHWRKGLLLIAHLFQSSHTEL